MTPPDRLHVTVVGSGAAGLSAAWLLARSHRVTLLERASRLGGHAHTARVPGAGPNGSPLDVDTGFIVYNEPCYPNLVAWFSALGVDTIPSDMSFAVSRDAGGFEYAGGPPLGLFAQPSLLLRPRYWSMLRGLLRFYREARTDIPPDSSVTLGEYLADKGYSRPFIDDHLMPFAAAVWSSPTRTMLDYPAAAFIRFCDNHGLLQVSGRPEWRTVSGGSRCYVEAVEASLNDMSRSDASSGGAILTGFDVVRLEREEAGVVVHAADGRQVASDHVVLAGHADESLAVLNEPDALEQALLGPFAYEPNVAVLHTDTTFLPRRRRAWCSWNHVERAGAGASDAVSVSYWMNRLQSLPTDTDYIVSLNPDPMPDEAQVIRTAYYAHPVFTPATHAAQQRLWSLQGRHRTWFCGSWFGAGFHEDAVQSGLAVAEALGGGARPWTVENPSGRIVLGPDRGAGDARARPATSPAAAA